jgi:hypothetical protein
MLINFVIHYSRSINNVKTNNIPNYFVSLHVYFIIRFWQYYPIHGFCGEDFWKIFLLQIRSINMERLFFFFLLILVANSCKKDTPECLAQSNESCGCITHYEPVCGCDGVTYGNACEAQCHGILDYINGVCPQDCERVPSCFLNPEVGPCNAAFPKYYYDRLEKKCKEFIWGGCEGIVPFDTMDECERNCVCK